MATRKVTVKKKLRPKKVTPKKTKAKKKLPKRSIETAVQQAAGAVAKTDPFNALADIIGPKQHDESEYGYAARAAITLAERVGGDFQAFVSGLEEMTQALMERQDMARSELAAKTKAAPAEVQWNYGTNANNVPAVPEDEHVPSVDDGAGEPAADEDEPEWAEGPVDNGDEAVEEEDEIADDADDADQDDDSDPVD